MKLIKEVKHLKDKSEKRAKEIIRIYLNELEKNLSIEVLSVILVGSLSNSSYTGNAGSDIDLIHILKEDSSNEARNLVKDLIDKVESITNNDLPIAKCIYKLNDMKRPFPLKFELCLENKDLIELPIEILRIKDSGITIWGRGLIDFIDIPTRDDIIRSRELMGMWDKEEKVRFPERYKENTKYLEGPPSRILIQSIIVNALRDYYFITGKSCSNKKEIGKLMEKNVGNYIFQELLDLCITFRYTPEEITQFQEQWMHEQYKVWRKKRIGKEIGSIEHLVRNQAK